MGMTTTAVTQPGVPLALLARTTQSELLLSGMLCTLPPSQGWQGWVVKSGEYIPGLQVRRAKILSGSWPPVRDKVDVSPPMTTSAWLPLTSMDNSELYARPCVLAEVVVMSTSEKDMSVVSNTQVSCRSCPLVGSFPCKKATAPP